MTDSQLDESATKEEQTTENPKKDDNSEKTKTSFTFTAAQAGAVFAGSNHGPLHFNFDKEVKDPPEPPGELEHARNVFCPPLNYQAAKDILEKRSIVVLRGQSSGRTHAARRLLCDMGITHVKRCSSSRVAKDFTPAEGTDPIGYLWLAQPPHWDSGRPLDDVLAELRARLESVGGKMVLVGDKLPQSTGSEYCVTLEPPRVTSVVLSHLAPRKISREMYDEFVGEIGISYDELYPTSSPQRGKFVATQLIDYMDGKYDAEHIRHELTRVDERDVAEWFTTADLQDRCLAISAAFLENYPWTLIFEASSELQKLLSNPENGEIWPYDPPDLFEREAREHLQRAAARLVSDGNDFPFESHQVRFQTPGWGRRLLAYVWKSFPGAREHIRDWLSNLVSRLGIEDSDAAASRFGQMLADSRERSFGSWLEPWTEDDSYLVNKMASAALEPFSQNPENHKSLLDLLYKWANSWSSIHQRYSAATALQGPIGQLYVEESMAMLRHLASRADVVLLGAITRSIENLATFPDNRPVIQRTLLEWVPKNAQAKSFVRRCSEIAIGLLHPPHVSFCEDVDAYRKHLDTLARHPESRQNLLIKMNLWCAAGESEKFRGHARTLISTAFDPGTPTGARLSYYLRRAFYEDKEGRLDPLKRLIRALREESA
jgi:hypothetical protein